MKIEKILNYLFDVKKPVRNFLLLFILIMALGLLKIGIIINDKIHEGVLFQVWVWAITIILLAGIICMSLLFMEGIFLIGGIIGALMVILPINFFYPQIIIIIATIGIIGHLILNITKKTKKKK